MSDLLTDELPLTNGIVRSDREVWHISYARKLLLSDCFIICLAVTAGQLCFGSEARSLGFPWPFSPNIGYAVVSVVLALLWLAFLSLSGSRSPRVVGHGSEEYAIIALALTHSAYVAEIYRSGIESVHPSQLAAAKSLGLNYRRTMRLVVLPQAARRVTPALLNDFVALQKDCGLISVLGAVDAVRAAQIQVATSYNFTPYVVAGLLFVALAVPSARVADWASRRAATRQGAL